MNAIAIWEQMNGARHDRMGQCLRLAGWDCFRKSRSMTVNEIQTRTGDVSH